MEAERSKDRGVYEDDKQKSQGPDYWVKYVEDKFQESKNFRSQRVEKQWMINFAYYKGHQNLKYNTTTGQLDWSTEDPLKFQINQTYAIVRAIRGAVTKDVPVWEVDAKPYGSINADEERLLSQYLMAEYEKLGMKHKVKELVLYGLLYGIGIFQYGFDPDADDGEGEVWVETFDPFDVYIDPHATGMDDARYVIKVIKRPVDVVKSSPLYQNTEHLQADNKHSESSYKDLLETREKEMGSSKGTMLLYEAWCKTDEGIRVITTGGGQMLRNELTDFEELPFVIYQPDITPNELYGEGWVKNLVPLNRALNYLERSTLEYHIMFAKGKFIADNNVNVKTVTNENGQIIRKSRAGSFEQMDIKPMSASVDRQIKNISRYMEDIGAAHETFMGRAPTGVTAAIAIEQLVANNMANLVDLQDNLEICLGKLGEQIIRLGYNYYDVTKQFKVNGSQKEVFTVGGAGVEMPGVIRLPERPEVNVTIGSGIAHTKGARQELALALFNAGVLDRRTLLERYEENADEIEQRLMEEQMAAQGMAPQGPEGGSEGFGSPEEAIQDFIAQAEAEGLQIDPALNDPEILMQVVSGQIEVEVVDGVITLAQ